MGTTYASGYLTTSSNNAVWDNSTNVIYYPISSDPVNNLQYYPNTWVTTTGTLTIVPPSLRSKDFSSFKKRALKLYKERYNNGEDAKLHL